MQSKTVEELRNQYEARWVISARGTCVELPLSRAKVSVVSGRVIDVRWAESIGLSQ